MIWQDYKKLYANALKTYSPKFKKELQKQVDTYCDTLDFDAISDKAIKTTIKQLHVAMGTRMAKISQKDVKTSVKGQRIDFEAKSKETDFFAYVICSICDFILFCSCTAVSFAISAPVASNPVLSALLAICSIWSSSVSCFM